jgi:thiol-disulfide isomerase/thioredoxin
MWRILRLWLILWLSLTTPAWAQIEESININDDLDIPVMRYEAFAEEAPILLWLPSSRGTSDSQAITASALGDLDIETWVVDLHTAYFVDAGRSSVQHFKAQDIADLIEAAAERARKKVYLIATDSVAKPALEGVARHQRQAALSGKSSDVGGVILFHPGLSYPTIEPGRPVHYVSVAKNSTIPIYYIQPSISTKQWQSLEIQETLQSGGSPVFLHPMPGISAGFHMRPDEDLSDADFAQRKRLPEDLKRAIKLLSSHATATPPKSFSTSSYRSDNTRRYGLQALREPDGQNRTALPLTLIDLQSQNIPVDYAENKISLISFWTSWCDPCRDELPSLKRLYDDFHDKGLRVITINVGESRGEIQLAIKEFSMSGYTNLHDPAGETMNAWNVHGYPTNFLVTASGVLSHGSIGGVAWDDAEVRTVIESLLSL